MIGCTTTFSNPVCDELCRSISRKSNGVCLAMCSLGKDSVASIIYCKQFFRRIIPFCCASMPCLKCHSHWVSEMEKSLGMRIIRLVGAELPMSLKRGMYQTLDAVPGILQMDDVDFEKTEIIEWLRYKFSLPKAWCAVGISVGDSIDRRIYCKKTKGINESHKTFYPLWCVERSDIVSIIRNSGVKLPDSYRFSCRSMSGLPSYTWLKILREHYPEDYDRVLSMWPLAEAKTYREKMLDAIWKRRKADGIVSDDGNADVDGGEIGADMIDGLMDLPIKDLS